MLPISNLTYPTLPTTVPTFSPGVNHLPYPSPTVPRVNPMVLPYRFGGYVEHSIHWGREKGGEHRVDAVVGWSDTGCVDQHLRKIRDPGWEIKDHQDAFEGSFFLKVSHDFGQGTFQFQGVMIRTGAAHCTDRRPWYTKSPNIHSELAESKYLVCRFRVSSAPFS